MSDVRASYRPARKCYHTDKSTDWQAAYGVTSQINYLSLQLIISVWNLERDSILVCKIPDFIIFIDRFSPARI